MVERQDGKAQYFAARFTAGVDDLADGLGFCVAGVTNQGSGCRNGVGVTIESVHPPFELT